MGKHRAPASAGPFSRRAASMVVAGAVPLSAAVISAAPAMADPVVPADPALTQISSAIAQMPIGRVIADPAPAPAPAPGPQAAADRNDLSKRRPVPDPNVLAPVDQGALHGPGVAPPVAPIQAPEGKIRIGSAQMDMPGLPDVTNPINEGAASMEAGLAQQLDSMGFEPSRSDRIAGDTLAGAAVGASVGQIVVSPLSVTSGAVGAVAGFIAGIPFLPGGLVVVPILGAAIGYGVVAAPAIAIGAGIGAAAGAGAGFAAPPSGSPVTAEPPATV